MKSYKVIFNGESKGIALVTALMFTLISLGIILASIYMVSRSTELTGLFKRYRSALEAADGAMYFFVKEFMPKKLGGQTLGSLGTYGGLVEYGTDDACLTNKLTLLTENWGCGSSSLDPKTGTDLRLNFGNFRAHLKITDTLDGNSDISGMSLEGMGVVEAGSGIISPQHWPYIYRIDVLAESVTGPNERALLTGLYAY